MAQNENEFNPEGPPLDSPQIMLEKIVEYATISPENINANVLRSMLYELLEDFGNLMAYLYNNSDEPAPFNPSNPVDTGSGKDK